MSKRLADWARIRATTGEPVKNRSLTPKTPNKRQFNRLSWKTMTTQVILSKISANG